MAAAMNSAAADTSRSGRTTCSIRLRDSPPAASLLLASSPAGGGSSPPALLLLLPLSETIDAVELPFPLSPGSSLALSVAGALPSPAGAVLLPPPLVVAVAL
jgi:hypothetical protein